MLSSTKFGKLFGIDLYVHGTFWLLPLVVLFSGVMAGDVDSAVADVVVLLAVFGCVALHEVGHATAAQLFGIPTRDITLYPVGGIASLERMPERPFQEIVIALAGPMVNVAIAAAIVAGAVVTQLSGLGLVTDLLGLNEFAGRLLVANLFLFGFNLIPAFPMDGGRVLRAMLAAVTTRLRATELAVTVSRVLAVAGIVLALANGQILWLLLAGMILLMGSAELAQVRAQEADRGWRRRAAAWGGWPTPRAAFSGWQFDPARRVWTEWHDGRPVREVPEV